MQLRGCSLMCAAIYNLASMKFDHSRGDFAGLRRSGTESESSSSTTCSHLCSIESGREVVCMLCRLHHCGRRCGRETQLADKAEAISLVSLCACCSSRALSFS